MIPTPKQLLAQAMELPSPERGQLAAMLIDSLETEVDDDADADQAWSDEIQRRIIDINTGRVQLIPWTEVRRRMRGSDESSD